MTSARRRRRGDEGREEAEESEHVTHTQRRLGNQTAFLGAGGQDPQRDVSRRISKHVKHGRRLRPPGRRQRRTISGEQRRLRLLSSWVGWMKDGMKKPVQMLSIKFCSSLTGGHKSAAAELSRDGFRPPWSTPAEFA